MENTEYAGLAAGKVATLKAIIENATGVGNRLLRLHTMWRDIKRSKITVRSYQKYESKKDRLNIVDMQILIVMIMGSTQQAVIMSQPLPRFAEGGSYSDSGRRGVIEGNTPEEIVTKWRESYPDILNIYRNGNKKDSMEL